MIFYIVEDMTDGSQLGAFFKLQDAAAAMRSAGADRCTLWREDIRINADTVRRMLAEECYATSVRRMALPAHLSGEEK